MPSALFQHSWDATGAATKVTDEPTLQRLAERYDAQGWPATVKDGAFIAPFSAERRATAVGPLRIHAKHRVRRGDSRAIRGHPLALRRLTGIRDPKPNLATIQSCGFRALWSAIRAQL
ncbi:MAG: hypothetical protein ACRDGV_04000 [Candidatus Limnocylindria bacterium]